LRGTGLQPHAIDFAQATRSERTLEQGEFPDQPSIGA